MQELSLQRLDSTDFATYGQLVDAEERALAVTLERPWLDNAPDVSCIPAGHYIARRYHSPKRGYDVFMLQDVPGRSAIEIHIANLPQELEGCIAIGSNFGPVNGQRGITGSAAAFARFMESMKGVDTFGFTITDPAPTPSL